MRICVVSLVLALGLSLCLSLPVSLPLGQVESLSTVADASAKGYKNVKVKGYTKKNGTRVSPHRRSK